MNAWEKQVTEQGLSMMTGKQRRERLENLMTNTVDRHRDAETTDTEEQSEEQEKAA